ncbi:DEAD/DEAH box helicase [Neosynechococcus sphagnicola]|uniref:DEAD/DEAH box helicase n=1 Tax=Neosynechococcus sphagnicola TaxID=1501145 RepID=UPI000B2EA48C
MAHPHASLTWEQVRARFQAIWGYSDFRPPQGEIVRCLLSQQDTLVILPTGGGKSVCFQLPALMQSGLTLVVSPLVALMENQIQELRQRKLPAALLHSELSAAARKQVYGALQRQQLRLLYLSPETLLSQPVWERLCQPDLVIHGLILDEAHCLVHWGDSFRPTYRRLGAVRPALLAHKPPGTQLAIAAFTATADPTVQQTIQQILGIEAAAVFRLSPYRNNLYLQVKTRLVTPMSPPHAAAIYPVQSQTGGVSLCAATDRCGRSGNLAAAAGVLHHGLPRRTRLATSAADRSRLDRGGRCPL